MSSYIVLAVMIFLGMQQFVLAGNQCANQFPGKGYCIQNTATCPNGATEYTRLSNGLGCPSINNRCCVIGGVPGFASTDRNSCGIGSLPLTSRIFHGINAGPCDWPFVVSIRAKLQASSRLDYQSTKHICAGVLIDRYWVLTSAICILDAGKTVQQSPNEFVVIAGEYNISGIDVDPLSGGMQEQLIRVQQAFVHPQYAYNNVNSVDPNNPVLINSHGIGLIKLAEPIAGRCSGLICLPNTLEANDNCADYKECVITGWGFTTESFAPPKGSLDKLKQGRVKLTSKKGCDLAVRRLGKSASRPAGTICQVPADILTDGCLGDEGGAVMCSSNGANWVVRGILPFQSCSSTAFNLFVTDVSLYLPWIKNTMTYYGVG